MWYEQNYRRHLCDMHIDDWDDSFLSRFSAEEYFKHLQTANISCAMIYLQSHVGLCYFPTKTGQMHKAFIGRENEMKKLMQLCHDNGIAVVEYYSLLYNTWAHDRHQDWHRLLKTGLSSRDTAPDGKAVNFETGAGSRYGICCPNNPDYLDFVYAQIDEMLDYYVPDALFFDMLYWTSPCYCPVCQKKWGEEHGGRPIPTKEDYNDPEWLELCRKLYQWMGEYAQKITDYVHKSHPEVTVEHNVSAQAKERFFGTGIAVNNASEFSGGDLAGGLLEESMTCKLYYSMTCHQPFEYMFPRCEQGLYKHTLTKTDETIEAAVFLCAAHHGATLMIDAIDPVGTLDTRVYQTLGKVFEKEKLYEPYLKGKMVADIGVVYGRESKGTGRFGNARSNHSSAVGLMKNMIEAGLSVGVVTEQTDLSAFKMIFAPCLWDNETLLTDHLLDYAKQGGTLLVSGPGNNRLIQEATGGTVTGLTVEKVCYIAPKPEYEALFENFNAQYPLHIDGHVPVIEDVAQENVLATVTLPYTDTVSSKFAAIHSNPPGRPTAIPAVTERPYGKGKILYFAASIESEGFITYQKIVRNLIFRHVQKKELTVVTDSPLDVETVTFADGDTLYVSNCLLYDYRKEPHMPAFTVRVRTAKKPAAVLLLPEKKEIPFTWDGEYVQFATEETRIFDMYEIDLK